VGVIRIFTTSKCPACVTVKNYLKKVYNLAYVEVNIEKSQEALQEIVTKTRQRAVPVIQIGQSYIVGFNQPEIDRVIKENWDDLIFL